MSFSSCKFRITFGFFTLFPSGFFLLFNPIFAFHGWSFGTVRTFSFITSIRWEHTNKQMEEERVRKMGYVEITEREGVDQFRK